MMDLFRQLWINKWRVKSPNVKFGLFSRVGTGSSFEGNNLIGKCSYISGKLGRYSYVGDNVVLIGCVVGRYTSISSNVHVVNGRHPIKTPYVSSSPVFYAKKTQLGCSFVKDNLFEEYAYLDKKNNIQVKIGNDCWVGYGVSIVGGIKIGDGAVVLANATVTKDIPPYSIVAGIPAKVVGYRYDEAIIERLLALKWWEKDDSWVEQKAALFCNIKDFLKVL